MGANAGRCGETCSPCCTEDNKDGFKAMKGAEFVHADTKRRPVQEPQLKSDIPDATVLPFGVVKKWTVTLKRTKDARSFGIKYRGVQHVPGVTIADILNDGLMKQYNDENPDNAVKIGDWIISANGQSDHKDMREEFKRNTVTFGVERRPKIGTAEMS